MKGIAKGTALAVCGGCLYVVLELLWRGRSHWTMFILGGVCFVLIGLLNEVIPWEMPLVLQGVMGSACIVTPLEFVTGCIVNLWLGWDVWDYSGLPCNLLDKSACRFRCCGCWWPWPPPSWMTGCGGAGSARKNRITH